MTLLDSVTAAAAAIDAGELRPSPKLLLPLEASVFLPLVKRQSSLSSSAPLRRLSDWTPAPDPADFAGKLVRKLRPKLRKQDSDFDRSEVLRILDSFAGERWDAIVGGEAAELVVDACLRLELWERLEGLISSGFLKDAAAFGLVSRLVEKNRADLLCLTARRVASLRPTDLHAILRFFLNPMPESREGMRKVKGEWERQGLLAIEKAGDEGLTTKQAAFARETSIMVMMAHDGFTASESCLHHVFSSRNAEGLVMSAAVSRLQGAEVLRLLRYFGKWLEKYERFPEAVPCRRSKGLSRLVADEWVPSLEAVAKGMSMVVDEHFSYLAMNAGFHDLLRSAEKAVKSLAAAANACHVLSNVLRALQDIQTMLIFGGGYEQNELYYLDISDT